MYLCSDIDGTSYLMVLHNSTLIRNNIATYKCSLMYTWIIKVNWTAAEM